MKNLRLSLILVLVTWSLTCAVGAANRVTTWSSGQILTASNLNAEFNNLFTGAIDRTGGRWGQNDDTPVTFGSSQDVQCEWETAQNIDSFVCGLGSGNIFSIMEKADIAVDWGLSSQTNPTLFVHSADSGTTTDFISITHDQTNAVISNGIGSINLVVEGATADAYETTLTFTDPTADQTVTIANATGTVMLTSLAANGAELANAVTGGSSSLIWEGSTANSYETTLTVTDPTADRTITLPDGTGTVVITGGTDLTVADGGTGASSLTDGGVLLGSGTGAITATAVLGDGVILIGDASGDPATLDVGSSSGITILGTIATGTWEGTTIAVNQGGSGATSLTDGGVLLGSGTGAVTATAVLADGEILIGDGSTDPVALDVGSSTSITVLGTIATGTWQATDVGIGYGGTGASSFTDGGVLLGSGSGALTPMSVLGDSELIVGDGTGDPVAESGATLRTSIGVGTGDSPQFTAVTLTAATVAILEGATADGYETSIVVTDPTADRTITLQNASGTVAFTSDISSGAVDVTGTPADNQIGIFTDANTLEGVDDFTWDDTNLYIKAAVPFLLEGATADGYETSIAVTDPTADRTITIPDVTGTILTTGAAVTVAQGGSGATSLTDGGVLLGSATGAITATAVLADGEILIGDGSTDPVALDVGSSSSITVLGTVATGTWEATDVGAAHGGTGASSLTDGGVLLGSGTGAITPLAVLGDGEIIIGDNSGDPVVLDIGSSTSVTIVGTIATGTWQATDVGVAYGGTGVSSLTDGGLLLGSGTGGITALGVAANGQIPIGDGSTDPQLATLTGTANEVAVTNGGGSITLSIPDASIFVTPRATGAAEFNSTVLIGANGTSLDGDVHLLASATDALPLVIETLSSQSTQAVEFHYAGSRTGYIGITGTARKFVFDTADLGNDAAGPYVLINRNSNSTSASAGYLAMAARGNQQYNVWADDSGDLRIGTTIPIGSQDTSGTVVGTQSSPEAIKNILFTYPNIPGDLAYEKFQAVINTPVKDFNFRSGKYNQNFTGLAIPDGQHPWYGQDPVTTDLGTDIAPRGTAKSLNELNMAGYFILSFKVLNKRIEDLENEINRLHSNRSSDFALNR